jgi:hypothetical protein
VCRSLKFGAIYLPQYAARVCRWRPPPGVSPTASLYIGAPGRFLTPVYHYQSQRTRGQQSHTTNLSVSHLTVLVRDIYGRWLARGVFLLRETIEGCINQLCDCFPGETQFCYVKTVWLHINFSVVNGDIKWKAIVFTGEVLEVKFLFIKNILMVVGGGGVET